MKQQGLTGAKKLSRSEMKQVMGGGGQCGDLCVGNCTCNNGTVAGACKVSGLGNCFCACAYAPE